MLAHLTGSARFSLARREQAERFKHPAHVTRFTVLHSRIVSPLIVNILIFLEKKYKNIFYIAYRLSPSRLTTHHVPRFVGVEPSFGFWLLEPCPFFIARVSFYVAHVP